MTNIKKTTSFLLILALIASVFMSMPEQANASTRKNAEVTFNKSEGDEVSYSSKLYGVLLPYGDLPVATKANFTFDGWYDGDSKVTTGSIVKSEDAYTLYARYNANKYNVNLNANGGKSSISKLTVAYDQTYGPLPVPKKTGYLFKGWYTNKTGGTKIISSTKVSITKDQTLYAQWNTQSYKISFKANSKNVKKLRPKSKKVKYQSKIGKLPKPKKKGYNFKGWYTKKKGGSKITSASKMKYTKNINLYAKWTKNGKIVNCKWVHLRKAPGNGKIIKGYVKKGTKISILGKVKNRNKRTWYKVKVNGKTGYIYSKYVKRM